MSFLSSATAEHILEANEGEEAKNAENCSNRKLNYLPNKKYLIVKKKDQLTIKVVNYAGFEIVFKSYSMLIFEHTHSSILPCY